MTPMDEIIARIAGAAGLDESLATRSLGIILNFLQKEGPSAEIEMLLDRMPGAREAMAAVGGEAGGGLGGMLGGLMGGGGGIMALGTQLMGQGLSLDQITVVGRELFAWGREHVGEDAMGRIVGSIPGLSQFV